MQVTTTDSEFPSHSCATILALVQEFTLRCLVTIAWAFAAFRPARFLTWAPASQKARVFDYLGGLGLS